MDDATGISIILPTYNRVDIMDRCIESVIGQTYASWELIIVDDASEIDIRPHISKYLNNDKRIKYYRNIFRRGLPAARNVGITISGYDYVLFIEDDMILETNAVELLFNDMKRLEAAGKKVGIVAPSIPRIELKNFESDRKKILRKEELKLKTDDIKHISLGNKPYIINRFTGIVHRNFIPAFKELQEVEDAHACCLYAKRSLLDVRGYDEKSYTGTYLREESDVNFRIKSKGYRIYFEPNAIFYHISISTGGTRMSVEKFYYYYLRNHSIYLMKNYRLKSLYMVPLFMLYITKRLVQLSFYRALKIDSSS